MTAVDRSGETPQAAEASLPRASTVSTVRGRDPQTACRASRVPSPTSAKGSSATEESGETARAPRARAEAAAGAEADPLKESGAQTILGVRAEGACVVEASSLMHYFNLIVGSGLYRRPE